MKHWYADCHKRNTSTAQRVPATEQAEAIMATTGRADKHKPAIIDFRGRWPLAFQVRMLISTGLLSSTPIPRR
jgi:hypothetical protein